MRASSDFTIRDKARRSGAVLTVLCLSAGASIALAQSNDIAGRKRCFVAGIETYKEEPVYRDRASGSQRVQVPGAKGERCYWEPLDYRASDSAAPLASASRAAAPAIPRRRTGTPTASPADQAQLAGSGLEPSAPDAPEPLAAQPQPQPPMRAQPPIRTQPAEEPALPAQPPLRRTGDPLPQPTQQPQPLAATPQSTQPPPQRTMPEPEPAQPLPLRTSPQPQPEPTQPPPQPLSRPVAQPEQPAPFQPAPPQPAPPQPAPSVTPRVSAPPSEPAPVAHPSMRPAPQTSFKAKAEPSMALKTTGQNSAGKPGTDGLNIRSRPVRSGGTGSAPGLPGDAGAAADGRPAGTPEPLAPRPLAPQLAATPEPKPVSPLPQPDPRPVQPAPEELPPFAASPAAPPAASPAAAPVAPSAATPSRATSGDWLASTNLGGTPPADPVHTAAAITTRPVPLSETENDSRPFQNWQSAEAASPPAAAAPPAAKPRSEPPAAKPRSAPARGGNFVQLGSVVSYQKAKQFWTTVTGRYPDELEGLEPNIVEAEIEGRGTFFRVRVGPMSANDAKSLCERLNGNCLVVKE